MAVSEMATSSSSSSSESTFSSGTQDRAFTKQEDFTAMLRDNFDLIVELLEERILSDIERRGGRYGGDF